MVRAIRDGTLSPTPVLDLTDRVSQDGGERGLLGIAFSPDGTHALPRLHRHDGNTQVDEFAMQGRDAVASSRRTILTVDQPQPNHNGGQLAFGPDGYLYIGLGDGGAPGDSGPGHAPGGNGQSLDTLLGKILRIDPNPSPAARRTPCPPTTRSSADAGARPEIWAYGLRNPWRFSFDRETGDLWIGDVGQNEWEEIDRVAATNGRDAGKGVNFGWNRLEGDHTYRGDAPDDVVAPVYEISHDTGACAVIGGFVYRGTKIPALVGNYLFSDTVRPRGPRARPRRRRRGRHGGHRRRLGGRCRRFGQANNGTLYVVSLSDGIFRVDAG